MKLLVDMNLSPRWVRVLRDAGWEATHWSAVGKANAPDSEIMAYAAAGGFVILTYDLDFGAILAATRQAIPSVVQIRAEDASPEAVGDQTLAALRHLAEQLNAGAILTIESDRTRMRLLPLKTRE
ncbi:MAG TPA: DUF5615 family PIN-like protein [Methylomirabilota bacterium]|nr:DUF5615 family PIN-like protein [Methylomirabilota bacterium]